MGLLDEVRARLPHPGPILVLPEGDDPRVIEAAIRAGATGTVRPLLLGDASLVQAAAHDLGLDPSSVTVRTVREATRPAYIERYSDERMLDPRVTARLFRRPLVVAAAMVREGDADALLAGAVAATGEVVMACDTIIGPLVPGGTTSSFFLIETPDARSFLFADCAVNPNPTAPQLADIAVQTAASANRIFGLDPRVALLSFSTLGSAEHPDVDKVREALRLARLAAPDLVIDGELQADTAVDLDAAARKLDDPGPVAGHANVLIFPDLDAGNIAYKLVRALGRARAVGVILQGYRRPVSDVSRNVSVSELVDTATLLAALAAG